MSPPVRAASLLLALLGAGCLDLQSSAPPAPEPPGTGGAPVPPEGAVRVMTWNLESFPLQATTPERVAEIVERQAPDVLAIQEIADPGAFTNLADALTDYEGVLNDDPGNYLRIGVLYHQDRVSLDEPTTLFTDDSWAFPRAPLAVRVHTPGFDFVLVTVHLKAQIDPQSRQRRAQAILELHDWLDARLVDGAEQDYVVVGDFNDELTDPPADNVFAPFLQDDDYRFVTTTLEEAGEYSYIPFEVMIDHALVSAEALDDLDAGSTQVLRLDHDVPMYRDISDHRPVAVHFVPPG